MVWTEIANLEGKQGPAGYNATGAAEDAAAIGAFLRGTAGPNAANAALTELVGLNVKNFGAKGDGVTDDTAAIRAAVAACPAGGTIYFPPTGSTNLFYKITDTVTVTTPSIRFLGGLVDAYAASIRCTVAGKIMFLVKDAGVVFENLALWGNTTGANGIGATVTGIESWGSPNGDCDAAFRGVVFLNLQVGIRTRGRNNTVTGCVFSTSLFGVIIDGIDATYHVGSGATQNRGNLVKDSRFHNIGVDSSSACIMITSTSRVLHAIISGNHMDSNSFGRHVWAVGTATEPIKGLTCTNNKSNELGADGYVFTYVWNSIIDGANLFGFAGPTFSGHGIVLDRCNTVTIANVFGLQIGRSGIKSTNSVNTRIRDCTFNGVGLDTGAVYHGLDIDSTNSTVKIDNVTVLSAPGWGFVGEPTASSMADCQFLGCSLGAINSVTVPNRVHDGLNDYIETKWGRIEDTGRKSFDFVAGASKTVATVVGGGNYGTFALEVEFTANGAMNTACYVFAKRFINPNGGAPVATAIGADSTAACTISIAAAGGSGVAVVLTPTNAVFGTVRVRASSGGASSAGNGRGSIVAMN